MIRKQHFKCNDAAMINIDFDPDHLHVPSADVSHDVAKSSVFAMSKFRLTRLTSGVERYFNIIQSAKLLQSVQLGGDPTDSMAGMRMKLFQDLPGSSHATH